MGTNSHSATSLSNLVSHPIFWSAEGLKTYIDEVLNKIFDTSDKVNNVPEDRLNSWEKYCRKVHQALSSKSGVQKGQRMELMKAGWLDEVWNPVGIFLNVLLKYSTTGSFYDGNNRRHIIRAMRNLGNHSTLTIKDYKKLPEKLTPAQKQEQLRARKDEVYHATRGMKLGYQEGYLYWLKKFPNDFCTLYAAGLDDKTNNGEASATDNNFVSHFSKFYNEKNPFQSELPSKFSTFVQSLLDRTDYEAKCITVYWRHGFKLNDVHYVILKNPTQNSKLMYSKDENEVLYASFLQANGLVTKMHIHRKYNENYISMDVAITRDCTSYQGHPPIIAFAENILDCVDLVKGHVAELRAQERTPSYVIIFTNKGVNDIAESVNQISRKYPIDFDFKSCSWTDLDTEFKNKILVKKVKVFEESGTDVHFQEIFDENDEGLKDNFKDEQLKRLLECTIPVLLPSQVDEVIPLYEERMLTKVTVDGSKFKVNEVEFLKDFLTSAYDVTVVSGILGMGKTGFLANMRHNLISQKASANIAVYISADDFEKANLTSLPSTIKLALKVKIGSLESYAVDCLCNESKAARTRKQRSKAQNFVLLIDGLDELDDKRLPKCFESINEILFNVGSFGLRIVFTTQPSKIPDVRKLTKQIHNWSIGYLNLDQIKDKFTYLEARKFDIIKYRGLLDSSQKLHPTATPLLLDIIVNAANSCYKVLPPSRHYKLSFILESILKFKVKNALKRMIDYSGTEGKSVCVSVNERDTNFVAFHESIASMFERKALIMEWSHFEKSDYFTVPELYPEEFPKNIDLVSFGLLQDNESFVFESFKSYFIARLAIRAFTSSSDKLVSFCKCFVKYAFRCRADSLKIRPEILFFLNELLDTITGENKQQLVKRLKTFMSGVENKDLMLILVESVQKFWKHVVYTLIELDRPDLSPNKRVDWQDENCRDFYFEMLMDGNLKCIEFCLEKLDGKSVVNTLKLKNQTPLMIAVCGPIKFRHKVVRVLLKNGAELEMQEKNVFEIAGRQEPVCDTTLSLLINYAKDSMSSEKLREFVGDTSSLSNSQKRMLEEALVPAKKRVKS